jgi:cytoplasmic iron level regulating protein YaaA (DUF328/UPF0246 family)
MLIVISPAKKLDFEKCSPVRDFSDSQYLDKSELLIKDLRKCSALDISSLMKLSDALTELNIKRYKNFKRPFTMENSKQAIYAFKGDTYQGFDAESMTSQQVKRAQQKLRILSGLYGVLSPLDLIQPYRLEMGTKFSCQGNKNLYDFWSEIVTNNLNESLKKEKTLVNLASKEYFSVINLKKIKGEVVTPVFKEKKGDIYKIISFSAKRARGMMSRYIIDNNINDCDELKNFNIDGYKYSKSLSSELEPTFIRG